jgi:hypothetical protein
MSDEQGGDTNPEDFKNMPWNEFLKRTYGSLSDDPIEREAIGAEELWRNQVSALNKLLEAELNQKVIVRVMYQLSLASDEHGTRQLYDAIDVSLDPRAIVEDFKQTMEDFKRWGGEENE